MANIIESVTSSFPKTTNEIDITLSDLIYRIVGSFRMNVEKKRIKDDADLNSFKREIFNGIEAIPPENRLPLDNRLIEFALDSAKYSVNTPEIRRLFSGLIASSRNPKYADYNHFAYVDVIRQLSSFDVKLFELIHSQIHIPACVVRRADDPDYNLLLEAASNEGCVDDIKVFDQDLMPSGTNISNDYISLDNTVLADKRSFMSLGNLERLGLVKVDYSEGTYTRSEYSAFFEEPTIKSYLSESTNDNPIGLVLGICKITEFGLDFAEVCYTKAEEEYNL